MKRYQLGEFEEIVLLTVAALQQGAYGTAIKLDIETTLSRSISMGAMHAALVRLEEKGYIRSHQGESTEERMGRPRRYFEITGLGKKAIVAARNVRAELWRAVPNVVLDIK